MKIRSMSRLSRVFAATFLFWGLDLTVNATLLAYEGFNYTGDLIPPGGGLGQGTGIGWNGAWFTELLVGGFPIDPNSLYPPTAAIPPTGGSIKQPLDALQHFWARRFVSPIPLSPGQSLWFSADVATSAEEGSVHYVVYRFVGGAEMRFDSESPGTGLPETWTFAGGSHDFGPVVTPYAHTLLVAEIHRETSTEQITFRYWVNPNPTTDHGGLPLESPVATQVLFGLNVLSFASLDSVVLSAEGGVATGSLHQYDELRIGTTYADINFLNVAPVAIADTATTLEDTSVNISVLANDTDLNGDTLTVSSFTQGANGTVTLNSDGTLNYTPNPNFNGTDTFSYTVSDGALTAVGTVTVSVAPANDPSVFGPLSDQVVSEGATLTFQLTATDPEGDLLSFSSPDLPAGAMLDAISGEFNWTPDFTQAGTCPVTFTVADSSGGMDLKVITIQVLDVLPTANHDPDCLGAVPSLSQVWPPNHEMMEIDILGVSDPDGDPVSITITRILQDEPTNTLGDGSTWVDGGGLGTAHAWVRAERNGSSRMPGNGRIYEIFFTASDGRGGTCSGSVKVGVPHDLDHGPAVDDGVRYDSTVPGGRRVN